MERLREIRWRRGMPLHTLAARAGVSPLELMRWEQHGIPPDLDAVQRVAVILGVDADALLDTQRCISGGEHYAHD